MITNLTILPAMLLWMEKALQKKAKKKEWTPLDEEADLEMDQIGLDEEND
jgi:uncharacterized protein